MRRIVTIVVIAVLGILGSASGALAAPDGYTVASDANLYRVDLATGTATVIGSTGTAAISGLTLSKSGTLYGIDTTTNTAVLVTIDTATGAITPVGSTGVVDASTNVPTGLTFTNDGRLIMAHQSNIYDVNITTGLATLLGNSGIGVLDSLATDCAGTVYSLRSTGNPVASNLVTVNTTTGAATVVGPLSPGIPGLGFGAGLDVDLATGILWSVTSDGVPPAGPTNINSIDAAALTNQQVASVPNLTMIGLAIASACPSPAEAVTATVDFAG